MSCSPGAKPPVKFFLCPSTPPRVFNPSGFAENYPLSDPSLERLKSPLPVIRLSERRPTAYNSFVGSSKVLKPHIVVSEKILSSSFFAPLSTRSPPSTPRLTTLPTPSSPRMTSDSPVTRLTVSPRCTPGPTPVARPSPIPASPDTPVSADLEARERAFRETEDRVAFFIARNREEDERRQAQLTARSRDRGGAPKRVKSNVEHPLRAVDIEVKNRKNQISVEKFRELQNSRRLQADQHVIIT